MAFESGLHTLHKKKVFHLFPAWRRYKRTALMGNVEEK